MARHSIATLLLTSALHALPHFAAAATIDVDTVLGPDHPYQDQTITVIDGDSPPTNVDIIDGALIGGQPGQFAVPTGLDAHGQSVVTMFGGIIVGTEQSVRLNDDAVFHSLGGEIDNRAIEARDASRVFLDDGRWNSVNAFDSSRIHVNGGDNNFVFFVKTFGESHPRH